MFETTKVTAASEDVIVEGLDLLVSIDDTETPASTGEMGIFGRRTEEPSVRRIPAGILRENLQRTVDTLQQVLAGLSSTEDGMRLQQAQVSFEVTATGGIAVVGTSAQVGAKGAITLTFGP
ncbi:hypothetical protein ACIBCU_15970 [Streptomyces sp. NPDC051064]|uniref:Pepco domain-containing protein n=1 Tax=Streptomyces sp. NPDC051064 TaxID=3365641 RepID=UPI00379F0253